MRQKRIILTLFAVLCLGLPSRAQSGYGWDAATNETIFNETLSYLMTMQQEMVGEPAYYRTQQLVIELQAAFKSDPYAWMNLVHNFCNDLEAIYPPTLSHPKVSRNGEDQYDKIRRALTRLRDYPMHEVWQDDDAIIPPAEQKAAFSAANKQWLTRKRAEMLEFLRSPRPTGNELQVAKVYSSGYIFRTKDACIGIDLCYGEGMYDAVGRDEIEDMLDAIFTTHAHGDHMDLTMIGNMIRKGKAAVGPSTMDDRYFKNVEGRKFYWAESQFDPVEICPTVTAQAYMSGQGVEPCLLYIIQIGDWRIADVGDNSDHRNEAKIYPLYPMVDIAMCPVFQGVVNFLNSTLQGPNPTNIEQIYFNLHENEWHHHIEGRVSYRFFYTNSGAFNSASFNYCSSVILDNGEYITLYK